MQKVPSIACSSRNRSVRAILGALLLLAWGAPSAASTQTSANVGQLTASADSHLRAGELRTPDKRALAFYQQAAELAEEALATDGNSAKAHFVYFAARGRVLLAKGAVRNLFALKSLRKHLDRSLQLDPDYPDALAAKGAMLMELPDGLGGDKAQGEELLRRAVAGYPVGPATRLLFAKALLSNGNVAAARKELTLASCYAMRQRRYRALRDTEALMKKVEQGLRTSAAASSPSTIQKSSMR